MRTGKPKLALSSEVEKDIDSPRAEWVRRGPSQCRFCAQVFYTLTLPEGRERRTTQARCPCCGEPMFLFIPPDWTLMADLRDREKRGDV